MGEEEKLEFVTDIIVEMKENINSNWTGDSAFKGLLILSKYFDTEHTDIICGADHDILYSVDVVQALENGLTYEDATSLFLLNWMLEDSNYFSVFV